MPGAKQEGKSLDRTCVEVNRAQAGSDISIKTQRDR
jgi:hypothetical protein